MHALIIEDEPMIALLIEDQLRAGGYASVDFAVTEAEAVACAQRRCPDLITADVRLVEGCGLAAVEAICSHKSVPVIFISATVPAVRGRLADAVLIRKPFAAAELKQALNAVVRPG
jgi:DNA-binding response OmpR family regulator